MASAQDGTLDPTFCASDEGFGIGDGPRNGIFNSWVPRIHVLPDDRIFIMGQFGTYNGTPRQNLALLHPDGTLDLSFDGGDGPLDIIDQHDIPQAFALLPDGKMVIGGYIGSYNGTPADKLAVLNPDGSLHATLPLGSGPNSWVRSIIPIGTEGDILIGGDFDTINGEPHHSVARLDANDLSIDPGFDAGISAVPTSITQLIEQPDGRILVAGGFADFHGAPFRNLVRLEADGSIDPTFQPGTGPSSTVKAMRLLPNGQIMIAGEFTQYDGTEQHTVARLNTNGTLDAGFDPGIGVDANAMYKVNTIEMMPDGKVVVAGFFQSFGGSWTDRLVQLNTDGSVAATYDNMLVNYEEIHDIAVQSDGRLLIESYNQLYDGSGRSGFMRLNTDTSVDSTFNPGTGFNYPVKAIAAGPNGRVVVGGHFSTFNNTAQSALAVLTADGDLYPSFNMAPFFSGYDNVTVHACIVQPDDKILIGGLFGQMPNAPGHSIARLEADGSIDATFITGSGVGGINVQVMALALQPDGKILVGGHFTNYNGVTRNRILRINSDGTLDTDFDALDGPNADVKGIALRTDGKFYIWGYFTSFNGTPRQRMALLNTDGSLDADFDPGVGPDDPIEILLALPNNAVMVGGQFQNWSGGPASYMVRLNGDGSVDGTFNIVGSGPNARINSFLQEQDGYILFAGEFTTYNGTTCNGIGRMNADGNLDPSFNSGAGTPGIVTMVVQPNGHILIGGGFLSYDGTGRNRIARITSDISTGFHAADASMMTATPNPTSGVFTIIGPFSPSSLITVLNVMGRTVREINDNTFSDRVTMDLSGEASGLYTVRCQSAQSTTSVRLVKE